MSALTAAPEPDDDATIYLDPSCDLIDYPADKARELAGRGVDARVDRLQIARYDGSRKHWICSPESPHPAFFPTRDATRAWLLETFGEGSYWISARNAQNRILIGQRLDLGESSEGLVAGFWHPASPGMAARKPAAAAATTSSSSPRATSSSSSSSSASSSSDDPMADLTRRMLQRAIDTMLAPPPPPPPPDPLRETVASIAALLAETKLRPAAPPAPPAPTLSDRLLERLLEQAIAPAPPPPAPAPAPNALGQLRELVELMRVVRELSPAPATAADPDENPLVKVIPDLADSIGPGLITAIAHGMLPPDKATAVQELIAQHLATRAAEAKGDG